MRANGDVLLVSRVLACRSVVLAAEGAVGIGREPAHIFRLSYRWDVGRGGVGSFHSRRLGRKVECISQSRPLECQKKAYYFLTHENDTNIRS